MLIAACESLSESIQTGTSSFFINLKFRKITDFKAAIITAVF